MCLFIIYLLQKATVLLKYLSVSYPNMVFYAYKWSVKYVIVLIFAREDLHEEKMKSNSWTANTWSK